MYISEKQNTIFNPGVGELYASLENFTRHTHNRRLRLGAERRTQQTEQKRQVKTLHTGLNHPVKRLRQIRENDRHEAEGRETEG